MSAAAKRQPPPARPDFPDGLDDGHARARRAHRWTNLVSIVVLGGIVLAALLGVFGGGRSQPQTVTAPDALLTVATPTTMRSGIFFETRVTVAARRPLRDVVIALPPALWRDQTINTAIPAADKEESNDGTFRFHYGKLAAGETIELKFDGQINPPLFAGTKGAIALLDVDRELARVTLRYRVWP